MAQQLNLPTCPLYTALCIEARTRGLRIISKLPTVDLMDTVDPMRRNLDNYYIVPPVSTDKGKWRKLAIDKNAPHTHTVYEWRKFGRLRRNSKSKLFVHITIRPGAQHLTKSNVVKCCARLPHINCT